MKPKELIKLLERIQKNNISTREKSNTIKEINYIPTINFKKLKIKNHIVYMNKKLINKTAFCLFFIILLIAGISDIDNLISYPWFYVVLSPVFLMLSLEATKISFTLYYLRLLKTKNKKYIKKCLNYKKKIHLVEKALAHDNNLLNDLIDLRNVEENVKPSTEDILNFIYENDVIYSIEELYAHLKLQQFDKESRTKLKARINLIKSNNRVDLSKEKSKFEEEMVNIKYS